MSEKAQTLKGFRDFGPQDMALRNSVINKLRGVFERFGYEELQTPAIEYQEVLLGKYGAEAEKLMYLFNDPGDRAVGLKYDLTVPLARYISSNQNTPLPFKRYQIQPVYRAENTQKGRYREFYQCDVDIIGSKSPTSDAEILAIISESLKALKLNDFTININSRAVLFKIMESVGLPKELWLTTIQSIDKLDKKTKEEVTEELLSKTLSNGTIESLFNLLSSATPDEYLEETINAAKTMGATNIEFNPAISRGLDYYTGPIFETIVSEPKIGSVTGGGRYDELLKTLGGPDLPAVGTTIGLERIIDVIKDLKLWKDVPLTNTQVLVTVFNESLLSDSVNAVQKLRGEDVNVELYTETADLGKQLKYADKKQIPYVIVVGPEESEKRIVKVKNMKTGDEKSVELNTLKQSVFES